MRGNAGFQVDAIVKAVLAELPGLDPARLRTAVERGLAAAERHKLDTEGVAVVDRHLARVEATEEATEKAQILRELADTLEHERHDPERAIVVRLAAFAEAPRPADLDALLRLATATDRWHELPLDQMLALLDHTEDAGPRRLRELATIVQRRGDAYRAADCYERILVIDPADLQAYEALELFYRSTAEWGQLIELLDRRAVHVETERERAELFREMAVTYERELGDAAGALDAWQRADELAPDHLDALEALARLYPHLGGSDDALYAVLERLAPRVGEPKRRANILVRAANLCQAYDRAQALFEQALADDPDLVAAVDGLALLLRDRGELAPVVEMLVEAASRPSFASERARWLADAADFCLATGDIDRAKSLYREARAADPTNHKAGLALVELGFGTGSLVELVPILDELCASTSEPGRLRGYLLQRHEVARDLGDTDTSRAMLTRAVELDPHDPATRRELADLLFEHEDWRSARALYESLLEDHEDLFQAEVSIELHYRVARCARELGDRDGAAKHAAVTLALAPHHRPALLLRAELDIDDPQALLADELALANLAPVEERGAKYEHLGDRYALLGDRATSREMFREALTHRPSDHLLLTKFLGLVADEGDWTYSLDLVQRLIETEKDPKVRARYRHLAAMIARDELHLRDRAVQLFGEAVDDDPRLFSAADELEAMLSEDRSHGDALLAFYSRRLGHVKADEGRQGERLRLWDRLGELCRELGRYDDAVAAAEVGIQLDPGGWSESSPLQLRPDSPNRRQALADLYLLADPKHDPAAIALHHELLRANKRRPGSYEALRTLHRRQHHVEAARACEDALAMLGVARVRDKIDQLFGDEATGERRLPGAAGPLANEDWIALARLGVDLQLSQLFGLLAPAFAAERARTRPVPAAPRTTEPPPAAARVVDRCLRRVLDSFGLARPITIVDRDQASVAQVAMRAHKDVLVPVLSLGRPVVDGAIDEQELTFTLASRLADLRSDRIARLLCPRPSELAQILELAARGDKARGQWLAQTLTAADIDQAYALGTKYKAADPNRLALEWLAATDRAGDRIGLVVVGDLATCIRVLEREAGAEAAARTLELVWASVTEEVLAVRARVEGWRSSVR